MGAVVLDETDLARAGTEADEVFAQEPHAQRPATRLDLIGADGGNPVLAKEVAHRRARADPTQILVLLSAQHAVPPCSTTRLRTPLHSDRTSGKAISIVYRC